VLAVAMSVLALALAVAVVFLFVRAGSEPEAEPARPSGADLPDVRVPDLVGREVEDATNALQSIGLEIVVDDPTPNPSIPANQIFETNPPGDALAAPGTLVRVLVSGGRPAVPVPDVAGLQQAEAERILREAGFELSPPLEQASADVPSGTAISTNPPADEELSPDTPVQLVVSTGPPPFTLTRVIGLSENDAVGQLQALGLQVEVTRRFSTASDGQVLDQTPDGGIQVRAGDTVTLVVSLGPS
jgi:serine/threonine-protein kinase